MAITFGQVSRTTTIVISMAADPLKGLRSYLSLRQELRKPFMAVQAQPSKGMYEIRNTLIV
jgi:hypothetical protein